jgi:hypothetical protein
LFGYRVGDVEEGLGALEGELAARDAELKDCRAELGRARDALPKWRAALAARDERIGELDRVTRYLAKAVVERDGELAVFRSQIGEIEAQARGQATRIRMQALRQAVQLASRGQVERVEGQENGLADVEAAARGIGAIDTFEGTVQMEVGPLRDFSQLVSFEDAVTGIGGAKEISVKRFSKGRATLSLRLERPTELLRELEQRAPFEIRVRSLKDDRLIVDVDEADAA